MLERPEDLPDRTRVVWRHGRGSLIAAVLAAVAWPPLVITLIVWPPQSWIGPEMDWRLIVLIIGLIAAPVGLWFVNREREHTGRPSSRLGVIWRFMLYGGLLAAVLAVMMALTKMMLGWFEAGSFLQGMGATETILLIYGVGGMPVAILVGVSYALWAGACIAFLAFQSQPEVKDRLGLMDRDRA